MALKKAVVTGKVEDVIVAKALKNRSNLKSKQAKRDYIKYLLAESSEDISQEETANQKLIFC